MKKTSVEMLVEDVARSIVDSWLRLDEINDKFQMDIEKIKQSRVYLPKISEGPISMKEEALFDQNNFYEQVLDIDNIDNDQQTKNSVFEYYFSEQKSLFEIMYPGLSYSQIRANAALCFKSLSKQDKISYMKKYLKDKIYKRNGKGGSNEDYYMQQQENNYHFSDIQQSLSIPSLFDRVDNANGRNEPTIIQEFYSSNDFQGSILREKSAEPNGSIFKRLSSNSHSHNTNKAKSGSSQPQSSDKTGSKPDESKQQPQFQVLRSLFKRLQSTI